MVICFFFLWPYAVFHKMQVVLYKEKVRILCISNIYEVSVGFCEM